jgi:flagella basal body P-ring formation protein FlgA
LDWFSGMDASSYKIAVGTLLLSGIVSSLFAASGVDVKLRERAVPTSAVVRLGDVAEVVAADRQLARQLAGVPLMPAPAPETERFLRQREVADMLEANGVDLQQVQFAGAERVLIIRRGLVQQAAYTEAESAEPSSWVNPRQAILNGEKPAPTAAIRVDEAQSDALKQEVCRVVGEYVKAKTGAAETRRVECNIPDRQILQLAAAKTPLICGGGSEPWSGKQRFELSFKTAKGTEQVVVTAEIAAPQVPVVVATRAVERGKVITAADVEMRPMESSGKSTGSRAVVDAMEKVIGMEARQAVQVGDVIYADQVQMPIVVKRGELITVGSQADGIRVRTRARAMQDGMTGELIQVESLEGKQRFDARVTGYREAAVFTATRVSKPIKSERDKSARRPFTVSK